jgi:hypothetical protein
MDQDNYKPSTVNSIDSENTNRKKKGSGLAAAARAFRATTAIAVFGVPLVAGVSTILGYGIYKAFKRSASCS